MRANLRSTNTYKQHTNTYKQPINAYLCPIDAGKPPLHRRLPTGKSIQDMLCVLSALLDRPPLLPCSLLCVVQFMNVRPEHLKQRCATTMASSASGGDHGVGGT